MSQKSDKENFEISKFFRTFTGLNKKINRKIMKNLNFPLKKTDLVKTECGFEGQITKYSSNKEITITPSEDYAISVGKLVYPTIFSKENIIEVNGVVIESLISIKSSSTSKVDTDLTLPKVKVTSEGWRLFDQITKEAISPAFKTCFSFAKYLKDNGLKVVNSHILPAELQDEYDGLAF